MKIVVKMQRRNLERCPIVNVPFLLASHATSVVERQSSATEFVASGDSVGPPGGNTGANHLARCHEVLGQDSTSGIPLFASEPHFAMLTGHPVVASGTRSGTLNQNTDPVESFLPELVGQLFFLARNP